MKRATVDEKTKAAPLIGVQKGGLTVNARVFSCYRCMDMTA